MGDILVVQILHGFRDLLDDRSGLQFGQNFIFF
jgi:hypothetical protein